ncbi:MAG: 2,3-bisphosphoglycerate-independent phosphoglycerate mutase [Alphaproteobacteria bacterium]
MNQKVVLCILDGWGIGPEDAYNGIKAATYWPTLLQKYPNTQLQASDHYVGLPDGQMGNSEVGHMAIGLGRVLMQDLPKIDQAISSGKLKTNEKVLQAIEQLKKTQRPCHLMGLLSPGGVHSHMNHIIEVAKLLSDTGITVHVHGFLDGRDTPPKSAASYVGEFLNAIEGHSNIHLSTLGGRYFAMDRDNRWERIELAYKAIVQAKAPKFLNAVQAINDSYESDITDEFILPTISENYAGMQNGDGLWMINFRSDRVRQILRSLLVKDFCQFDRGKTIDFGPTLAMNEYAQDLNSLIPSVFSKDIIEKSLGEVIASHGMKQLRVAETEKYAHVTFFLNGGREKPFQNEERIMIPSPSVATYDLQPEMSAAQVTLTVAQAMERNDLSLIVVNYANTDMVGHTGVIDAIYKAVDCVDACVKTLEQKAIEHKWTLLITADHGNVECMREKDHSTPHTAHTCNPVPIVLVNGNAKHLNAGSLADVAPTVLSIMGITQPKEMTGTSLLC